ncbi:MAG: JAB domain-containing protein [Bdellovibrionales bacterium]
MKNNLSITDSQMAFRRLSPLSTNEVEEVWVVALNSSHKPIQIQRIFRGTVDSCLFHPRDIFRFLFLQNATSFILAHNHPSGEMEPSPQDIKVTRQLQRASRLMQIKFIDHIIFTKYSYVSLRDLGVMQ